MKFKEVKKLERQIKEIIEYITIVLEVDLDVKKERTLKEKLEDLVQDVKDDTIAKAVELLDNM